VPTGSVDGGDGDALASERVFNCAVAKRVRSVSFGSVKVYAAENCNKGRKLDTFHDLTYRNPSDRSIEQTRIDVKTAF
jgi:hypothetical protein